MFDRVARLIRRGAELRRDLGDLRIADVRQYGVDKISHDRLLPVRVKAAAGTILCGAMQRCKA
jgi:hypothetical protein